MNPQLKPQDDSESRRWHEVRTWPDLRGEPKLAWQLLWNELLGRKHRTVHVTPAAVGAHQGTSDAAGRRAITSLATVGLVDVLDRRASRWTLYLHDPIEVAIARRARQGDGQAELDFGDEPQNLADRAAPPPEVTPLPPTDARALPSQTDLGRTSEARAQIKTSDFGRLRKGSTKVSEVTGDGSDAASVAVPSPMASLMGRVLDRLPSPAERAQRIEELIALIQQRVADARLHVKPCLTVAEAICDGWYPLAQLLRVFEVLDRMDAAGRVQQRWSYFVGAARRSMREHDSREK